MQVKGKITIAKVQEGESPSTGNKWMKCHYVLAYPGHWYNGGECTRTLAFNVFGLDRLKELKIHKDEVGVLEFETRGEVKTSATGNQYETCDIDVLSWKVDAAKTPHEVQSQPRLQAPQSAEQKETVLVGKSEDGLPF